MTVSELYEIWTRYMHRSDLSADLNEVFRGSEQLIQTRLMFPATQADLDDILANWGSLYVHAGLIRLHELAQNDEGMMRESGMFGPLIDDYQFYRSMRDNNTIAMGAAVYAT